MTDKGSRCYSTTHQPLKHHERCFEDIRACIAMRVSGRIAVRYSALVSVDYRCKGAGIHVDEA